MARSFVTAVSLALVLGFPARTRAHLLRAHVQPAATSVNFEKVVPCHPKPWEFVTQNDTIDDELEARAFSERFRKVIGGPTAEMVSTGKFKCRATGEATDRHAFTMVKQKGPMICQSGVPDAFRFSTANSNDFSSDLYAVHTFYAPRNLPAGGKARRYAEAWPAANVCTKGAPCPLVVSLHTAGDHSDPQKLKTWGYLNYYFHDASCRASLRSVMIFPQLHDRAKENFGHHGPAILADFIAPLVEHFLTLNHNVDRERVALVGTSEGAMGAIMASVLYPDVFSVIVAAAATVPLLHFPQVPRPLRKSQASDKLRTVVLAWDGVNKKGMNQMDEVLSMLVHAGTTKHAAVRGRFYVGVDHMETAESVLNHYSMLHLVLWLGEFGLAGQLW